MLFNLGQIIAIESNIGNATGRHTADALIDGHFVMVKDCITFAEINKGLLCSHSQIILANVFPFNFFGC